MKVISSDRSVKLKVPIDGAGSDIVDGALLMPGVTAASNFGTFIKATGAAADAFGIKEGLHDFSEVGDSTPEDGLVHVLGDAYEVRPGDLVAAEYDTDDTMTVSTVTSTTVYEVSSLEASIASSWFYSTGGTGPGQLMYILSTSSDAFTIKSALTTALSTDTTLIKILRVGHGLLKLNSNADKLGTDAAAGTFTWRVLKNQFRYDGKETWTDLNPVNDHNLQLNGLNPRFRAILVPVNTFSNPVD